MSLWKPVLLQDVEQDPLSRCSTGADVRSVFGFCQVINFGLTFKAPPQQVLEAIMSAVTVESSIGFLLCNKPGVLLYKNEKIKNLLE